jgi:SAM-dependent methyltransferase
MFGLFKKDGGSGGSAEQTTRHSRGWSDTLAHLKSTEGLRVLDFGSTSPTNINYLTGLGHSVYMANIVQDAAKPDWLKPVEPGTKPGTKPDFDTERFVASNLDFSGRDFDVILLWDTANYLPAAAVPAVFERLREVLRPDGRLLAFFHGKTEGPGTSFSRYQLTDGENLVMTPSGNFPVVTVYQTRQIEKFLEGYSDTRFFLGKDNMREVRAIR